jgi:fermentation-respiration switch protein FrsA (DUF1100 family)
MSEQRFSRWRNPGLRIAGRGRKLNWGDPSFSGGTGGSRWLHFLLLPFLAGDFPKAQVALYLYAAVKFCGTLRAKSEEINPRTTQIEGDGELGLGYGMISRGTNM